MEDLLQELGLGPGFILTQLSKKFMEQIQKGNVDIAIKLMTNNMQNGMLTLTDTTLNLLKQKPPRSPTTEEVFLPDQPESIHRIKYEDINADAVGKAALKTKAVLDLQGWRKMVGKEF